MEDTTESALSADEPGRTPSRLDIDPSSSYAEAVAFYTASDRAQITAFEVTAKLFLADVIAHLNLLNPDPDRPYEHASFFQTVRRFAKSAGCTADWVTADDAEDASAGMPDATSAKLPGFPRFRPTQTFDGWVHMHSHSEDIAELTSILGTTIGSTYAHVTHAMTLIHGLPKFHARCLAGEFTIEHVIAATRQCENVHFSLLPVIDEYLCQRRPDVTIQTFKKSLSMKIGILQPPEDRTQTAHERRRVSLMTNPDGSACMMLTGSSAELQACYLRIEAFAKAIRNGNTAAFADQLPEGACLDDLRGIDALMFDILTSSVPQLRIQVRARDTETGSTTTRDIPLDLENVQTVDDMAAAIHTAIGIDSADGMNPAANTVSAADTEGSSGEPEMSGTEGMVDSGDPATSLKVEVGGTAAHNETTPDDRKLKPSTGIRMTRLDGIECDEQGRVAFSLVLVSPTAPYWLAGQARMMITVPCMSLMDDSDLPGTFSDGTPVPAETARMIAGNCSSWMRILTDPATGTPIDAKATSYYIPEGVRNTLVSQWQWCSMPGCRRRAESSQIDHIIPFNHDDPAAGGLTVFGNLHPMCEQHHQGKTDGRYSVRMNRPGVLEYTFAHGTRVSTVPGDSPVNAENARLIETRGDAVSSDRADTADHSDTLEHADTPDPEHEAPDPSPPQADSTAPAPGEVRISRDCPGPAADRGSPGWAKRTSSIRRKNPAKQEWVWDNGEPPPF